MFLIGISGFALSSVACGLADDALHLVRARIAHGAIAAPIVGGALIDVNIGGMGWRPIFFINAQPGVAGVFAASLENPSTKCRIRAS